MSAASAWNDQTPGSVSRMNLMDVVSGTGAYLASLDYSKHKILVCTSTGSGFIIDHVYLCETDGSGVIDISSSIAHNHSGPTEGGYLSKVFAASPEQVDTQTQFMFHIKKADFTETITSTGTTADVTSGVNFDGQTVTRVASGATSGATADLTLRGLKPTFSFPSYFALITSISSTASVAGHWGFQVERMQDADDNVRKYGAVICTATNGNWFIRSADGTARSDSDTGTAFSTSDTSIVLRHNSDLAIPSVEMFVNNVLVLTKTTNMPTTSTGTSRDAIFRYGVKNSAAADKQIHLKKLRFGYWIDDTSFSA